MAGGVGYGYFDSAATVAGSNPAWGASAGSSMVELRNEKPGAVFSPANFFRRTPNERVRVMGKLNVRNGTPVGSEHLCKSCVWCQYTRGYRETDVLVICTNTSPNLKVPFPVHECSEYEDKAKPDWEQMKKLAIEVAPTRTSRKTAGFRIAEVSAPVRRVFPDADEDGDEDEEVARLL